MFDSSVYLWCHGVWITLIDSPETALYGNKHFTSNIYTVIEYKWNNINVTTSITPKSADVWDKLQLFELNIVADISECDRERAVTTKVERMEHKKMLPVVFSLLFSNLHRSYVTHWHELPSHSCSHSVCSSWAVGRRDQEVPSPLSVSSRGSLPALGDDSEIICKAPTAAALGSYLSPFSVLQESDLLLRPEITVEGCYFNNCS